MKARLPKGMGGGPQNMQSMIKQAQKMQEEMERTQEELNEKEYTTSAGGGMVECTINGKKEIVSLNIKKEAVDPEDVEILQDMIIGAVNEATAKWKKSTPPRWKRSQTVFPCQVFFNR